MTHARYIAALLTLSLALPAFAGGGGGGGGRGGRGGGNNGNNFGNNGNNGNNNANNGNNFGIGNPNGNNGFGPGGFTGGGGFQPNQGNNQGNNPRNQGNQNQGGRNNLNTRGMSTNMSDGDYAILDSVSIFSRDRRAIRIDELINVPPVVMEPPRPQPVDPGSIPVLRGIIQDNKGWTAMLETMQLGNILTYKVQVGGTIPYNNAKVVDISSDSITINTPSSGENMGETIKVMIGNNIRNEATQASSVAGQPYISQDLLAAAQQNNTGGGGRGGRGGRGGGGGAGAGGFGGGGGVTQGGFNNGGFGGGGIGLTGALPANVNIPGNLGGLVNPSLDPPLPPGPAESLEQRMMARRQQQVGVQN
jgi:hypothetical protein